ncbi:MAG: DUF2809 domain-containing protein [Sarcina sp.]
MKFRFSYKYLISFIIFFIIEILIALFVHDNFIRPYIGDILVIILIYTFIRIFVDNAKNLPIYIFFFAVFIEVLQLIKIVELLGMQDNKIISIIIGTTFDVKDLMCYFIGSIILIGFEFIKNRKNKIRIK